MHAATDYGAIGYDGSVSPRDVSVIINWQPKGFERAAINPSFLVAAAGAESQP
jgi:hypothetical protein